MRRIVVSEFLTLDGVMEDPGGAEGFERGGWAFQFDRGPEGDAFKYQELMDADALLLGRRTYEGFAKAWPSMTDEAGFAAKMNGMAKHVVSSTLRSADWSNSTIIDGDPIEAVRGLKGMPGENILLAGSAQLAQALAEHRLVDEYRLLLFPTVLGAGKRLFAQTSAPASLRMTSCAQTGQCTALTYVPA